MKLTICKAEPVGKSQTVPDVEIFITAELPDFNDFAPYHLHAAAQRFYEEQAEELTLALFAALPQGTLHALLVELLQRKVDLYRGPQGD